MKVIFFIAWNIQLKRRFFQAKIGVLRLKCGMKTIKFDIKYGWLIDMLLEYLFHFYIIRQMNGWHISMTFAMSAIHKIIYSYPSYFTFGHTMHIFATDRRQSQRDNTNLEYLDIFSRMLFYRLWAIFIYVSPVVSTYITSIVILVRHVPYLQCHGM